MEINVLLDHAQLLDTLPSYQTHPAQLLDTPLQTEWLQYQQKTS